MKIEEKLNYLIRHGAIITGSQVLKRVNLISRIPKDIDICFRSLESKDDFLVKTNATILELNYTSKQTYVDQLFKAYIPAIAEEIDIFINSNLIISSNWDDARNIVRAKIDIIQDRQERNAKQENLNCDYYMKHVNDIKEYMLYENR
jgi:hypothetical protein